MPALLEPDAVEVEALNRSTADSLPGVAPHNRYKPRYAARDFLLTRICFTLIVVGVFLRAWQLDQVPGVNGDEAWYGVQSQRFLDEYIYGKTLPEAERVNFRTPTGNVWNPFLMIPRIVLDATFAPSVWSLRLPALASGLLTLLVNWWLCRRAFNRTTAALTTALLSVLPVAMIYSRLGWDACQSILFCLPLVYLPWLAERRTWSGLRTAIYFVFALAAALLVHPTNIFVVPVTAALFWPRVRAVAKLELSLRSRVLLAVTAVGGAIGLGITRGAWAGVDFDDLFSALEQWAGDVVGLFNGATVYGSISLPAEELPTAQRWLLFLSLPTIAILVGTRLVCKTPLLSQQMATSPQRYAALFDGTGLALLCFFGISGPGAIQPGYERYGLWIIAPGALLIVLAYANTARRSRDLLTALTILTIVQVTLLLAGYWQYYQRRFDATAAEQRLAHWTYRADNYSTWQQIQNELNPCLDKRCQDGQRYIVVDPADPQRWWFEWKWRYLSHDSRAAHHYQWLVLPAYSSERPSDHSSHGWILHSKPDFQKEKLGFTHLW